jgi:hypothetical protein
MDEMLREEKRRERRGRKDETWTRRRGRIEQKEATWTYQAISFKTVPSSFL